MWTAQVYQGKDDTNANADGKSHDGLYSAIAYGYCYHIVSFVQGIPTYIPETNHVSRVYTVAAIPHLLFIVHTTMSSILDSFVLLR
jgi:hypothetical protein